MDRLLGDETTSLANPHCLFLNPSISAKALPLKAEHLPWIQLFEEMVLIRERSGLSFINSKALPSQLQPVYS